MKNREVSGFPKRLSVIENNGVVSLSDLTRVLSKFLDDDDVLTQTDYRLAPFVVTPCS
jgi:hypothetical protein